MLSSSSYSWPIAMAAIIFCLLTSVTYVYRTKQAERSTIVPSSPLTSFSMLSVDHNHDMDIEPLPNDKAGDMKSLSKDQIPKNTELDKSHNDDKKDKNEKEKTKEEEQEEEEEEEEEEEKEEKEEKDKEEKKSKKEKSKDKKSSSEKESSSKKHKDATTKKAKKDDSVTDKEEEEEETYNREKQSKLPMMEGSRDTPPHIVFILADDLGWNSIGYQDYDLSFATPHLTDLARSGLILSNYYSQEVCTPARAALLTGRYPLSIGMQFSVVDTRTPWGLNLGEQTIADVLSEHGYTTRALGKWHLGHHSPKFLPTARGFDSFLGFLNGDNHYYSKRNPIFPHFTDFIGMDKECYYPYMEHDMHNYSTHFYRTKAIDIITNHDQSTPLFLYLPFQAVHDPFTDVVESRDNARSMISDEIRDAIDKNVVGHKRTDYAYALNLLDGAVGAIKRALDETGMMDNTYLIFASDNGGCNAAGGKNGPLRGTKGSLLEGGTKVDAFVYSPLLDSTTTSSSSVVSGSSYDGLFHVTDWFPTIIDMAKITDFAPRTGFSLDGVSQLASWSSGGATVARTHMLYNSFHNVKKKNFNYMTNGTIAVRNEQYKLIHFYDTTDYSSWYDYATVSADDDAPNVAECGTTTMNYYNGKFVFALYDLINDPYEKFNLYDDTSSKIAAVKTELYALAESYHAKAKPDIIKLLSESKVASKAWQNAGGYIVPYVKTTEVDAYMGGESSYQSTYPQFCRPEHLPQLNDDYILPDTIDPTDPISSGGNGKVVDWGKVAVEKGGGMIKQGGMIVVTASFFVLSHLVLVVMCAGIAGITTYCYCGGIKAVPR